MSNRSARTGSFLTSQDRILQLLDKNVQLLSGSSFRIREEDLTLNSREVIYSCQGHSAVELLLVSCYPLLQSR